MSFHASADVLAVPSASPPKLWALPESGLSVFHGGLETPRLFHYLLPGLIAQGKRALCLDGANRFDPLLIARFARRTGHEPLAFNQHLRVARAFTCFQLTELLVRAPRLLRDFPAKALVVTALPDLYFDEDVREGEAIASFRQALAALRALEPLRLTVAVFSGADSFHTSRHKSGMEVHREGRRQALYEWREGRDAKTMRFTVTENTYGPHRSHVSPASRRDRSEVVEVPPRPAEGRPRMLRPFVSPRPLLHAGCHVSSQRQPDGVCPALHRPEPRKAS